MEHRDPGWVAKGMEKKKPQERGWSAAKTATVNFNIYTVNFRERKELEVGHCVSGLKKNPKKNRQEEQWAHAAKKKKKGCRKKGGAGKQI